MGASDSSAEWESRMRGAETGKPGLWRESHYRVEGPVVAQMQQAFIDNWMATRAVVLHGDAYYPET